MGRLSAMTLTAAVARSKTDLQSESGEILYDCFQSLIDCCLNAIPLGNFVRKTFLIVQVVS